MICKYIVLITLLNECELFFSTQLKGFKYDYSSQSNINRLFVHSFFYFTHKQYPIKVLLHRFRVNPGVMAMKEYSTFPKTLGIEHRHQMV